MHIYNRNLQFVFHKAGLSLTEHVLVRPMCIKREIIVDLVKSFKSPSHKKYYQWFLGSLWKRQNDFHQMKSFFFII